MKIISKVESYAFLSDSLVWWGLNKNEDGFWVFSLTFNFLFGFLKIKILKGLHFKVSFLKT